MIGTCRTCDGAGEYSTGERNDDGSPVMIFCHDCDGTGEVLYDD